MTLVDLELLVFRLSSLLAEAFTHSLVRMQKKKSSDQNFSNSRLASKAREKQPGDPLSRSSKDAVQAELQLQATLAKKLKLKQVHSFVHYSCI